MIHLEVEEYCHGCRDFESDTHYDCYGEINNISIFCKHKNKCAQLKKYIERNTPTDAPKENLGNPELSKEHQCQTCLYSFMGGGCKLLSGKVEAHKACDNCPMYIGSPLNCKCATVNINEPCPYYKEAKNEQT